MEKILVSDIMTREPLIANPETNLLECSKIMVKKRTGSLLLVENKKLVGILCEHDILWALIKKSQKDLSKIQAKDISPRKLATIKPTATIQEAFQKMKRLKFERLPVVQEKELVGIITAKDILNFHPEFYPELEEFSKIREESRKLKAIKSKDVAVREGICEECGNHELLYRMNGILVCASCKDI